MLCVAAEYESKTGSSAKCRQVSQTCFTSYAHHTPSLSFLWLKLSFSRSLGIDTRPKHTPSSPAISINHYLSLLPSLNRLRINWHFPIIDMRSDARAAPCRVTTLEFNMHLGSDGAHQSSVDLIALQLPRMFEYLSLMKVRKLALEFSFSNSSFGDAEENWPVLGRALEGIMVFKELEDVSVKLNIRADGQAHISLWVSDHSSMFLWISGRLYYHGCLA